MPLLPAGGLFSRYKLTQIFAFNIHGNNIIHRAQKQVDYPLILPDKVLLYRITYLLLTPKSRAIV